MKNLIYILLPIIFFSCNKDDFDKEHSQHIVGKWRWVKTEIHTNWSLNNMIAEHTPELSNKTVEIEFKKNGTTIFLEDGKRKLRYLNASSNIINNTLFNSNTNQPYYSVSTSFTKLINHQEIFTNFIPSNNSDSLYSGYFPIAVSTSEGFIETYHAKSIFIRIE
jgi:hypothetical protein